MQGKTASVTVNISVTDVEAGKPDAPTLARTEYSEPTDPGLDVTWTRPALTGEAINRLQITGYEVQYRKKAADGEQAAAWTLYKYDDPEQRRHQDQRAAGDAHQPDPAWAWMRAPPTRRRCAPSAEWRARGRGRTPGKARPTRRRRLPAIAFAGGTKAVGGSFTWHEAAPTFPETGRSSRTPTATR